MKIDELRGTPHLDGMLGVPYDRLRRELITGAPDMGDKIGRRKDFAEHCSMLMREFEGRTRLEFLHAVLIVMIRRRLKVTQVLKLYYHLWENEGDFLCKALPLRWLISACDTLCDFPRNPQEATIAISAATLINTIKLYETERLLLASRELSAETLEKIQGRRQPLFDGLTTFKVGRGDMIRNLKRRLGAASQSDQTIAAKILFAAVERAFTADTVISRFRQLHTKEDTAW